MNIKRTIAAVIRAPLLAGDSIPNMANTEEGGGGNRGREREERWKGEREREREGGRDLNSHRVPIHTQGLRLTNYDHDHTQYLYS